MTFGPKNTAYCIVINIFYFSLPRSQNSCTLPPFVEFDMSAEGFGCLYLPSIAPQSANLNALGTQDTATLGGIGSGITPNRSIPYVTVLRNYLIMLMNHQDKTNRNEL